ncbi:ash family protein [Sodalis ligni]|nr:ash family protein [Sodalis ligni]
MVAQAGALQKAPAVVTGNVNSVWATTLEIDGSGSS